MIRTIIILACLTIVYVSSARILVVVPTPSISHQVVFRPLVQELATRGHDVTIITTDPVYPKGQAPANLTEIDLHEMSYTTWRETIFSSDVTSGKDGDVFKQLRTFFPLMTKVMEKQMQHPDVRKIVINGNQFDILLLEAWVRSALLFTHVFKNVPVILVSSVAGVSGAYDIMGAPARPPLLYPTPLRQRLANLSLMDKIKELYQHYVFESIFSEQDELDNKLIQKILGPEAPSVKELEKNVDMLFLNVHPLWDLNRPAPPSVLYMGGMHQKAEKELPTVRMHSFDNVFEKSLK